MVDTASHTPITRGVLFVHSAPHALSPHVEWAVGSALGNPVNFDWQDQPALRGSARAEHYWEGSPGTAAAIVSALHGWNQLRFEVTEDPSQGHDGVRYMHTPALGIFSAPIDRAGNLVLRENAVHSAIEQAKSQSAELERLLAGLLGTPWDNELEVYRHASDFAPVIWLHKAG